MWKQKALKTLRLGDVLCAFYNLPLTHEINSIDFIILSNEIISSINNNTVNIGFVMDNMQKNVT